MSKIYKFYHGGNLDNLNDNYVFKTNKIYHGAGLYLTNDYRVVDKYTKGSRKLYLVNVYEGNDINNTSLLYDNVIDFLKILLSKNSLNKILPFIEKRKDGDKIKMLYINNLLLNYELVKGKKTTELIKFYVDNNIDYEITKNNAGFGETTMVLYNLKKIKSIKRLNWNNDNIQTKLTND